MTQIVSPLSRQLELVELRNLYRLPEILTGNWDEFGECTRPEAFDSIDCVELDEVQVAYIGYKRQRQSAPRSFIPTGPAIFVGQTDGIRLVGRANVYYGKPANGTIPAPYVGFTKTYEAYRQGGQATWRLRVMNAACLKLYGQELHSGADRIAPHARQAWQRLVNEGVAGAYQDGISGQYQRYRFLAHSATAEI